MRLLSRHEQTCLAFAGALPLAPSFHWTMPCTLASRTPPRTGYFSVNPRSTSRPRHSTLTMAASPPPPPPSPPPSDDTENDTDTNFTPEDNDDHDEHSDDPKTEYLFSQEVLRRRVSEITNPKSKNSPSDAFQDLSIVTDAGNDVREELMSDDEAGDFINQFESLLRIWVIIFTNSTDGTEGVYSLSIGNDNIILAFQERQEAQRYAVVLEAQEFPEPQICEMDPRELRDFCLDSGFKLGFIPTGMVITPPEESAIDDMDKWRGTSSNDSEESTGMSDEDIDAMRKHFDSLFGQ